MESNSKDDFMIGSSKDCKRKEHQDDINRIEKRLKELENNKTEAVQAPIKDCQKDINYHQMRLDCIEKFEKDHTVPIIIAEDEYFDASEIKQGQKSTEELYPNNKEISLYETNQDGEKEFVVKQRNTISTCYFMAWILGLIDKGMGNYIKQNIVREHGKTQVIVRLHDEDGLPVDIVVSKVRPKNDNKRPLWLAMLDKAACVIMNRNRFGSEEEEHIDNMRMPAKIIKGISW